MAIVNLKVTIEDWTIPLYRAQKFKEARSIARTRYAVVNIVRVDKPYRPNKQIMATFDGRHWLPVPPWASRKYRTPEPR